MITDYDGVPVRFLRHDLSQIEELAPFTTEDIMPDERVVIIHKMITTFGHPSCPDWYKEELTFFINKEFEALQSDSLSIKALQSQIGELSAKLGEQYQHEDEYYLNMLENFEPEKAS